jgi:hypothetical protein
MTQDIPRNPIITLADPGMHSISLNEVKITSGRG